MESVLPVGAMRMPVQRQLSRLYHDTKKSSDFVKQPVQSEHDPDIKALHRKLRIQNDRLVSWGLEWSDPVQSAEIDESLSEAGLSDIVESIMSTIKDILAEAEPIWLGSKHLADASPPTADRKPPLAHWDKARFEDLVGDLTTSIDTLYDLPRTRSASSVSRRLSKTSVHKPLSPSDDSRPFESTRVQTPRHVDPTTLEHLRPFTGPGVGGPPRREVVFMSKTAYSELVQNPAREPWAPLLLEYAAFDPIYATTGIMPEMGRFEKLFAGLQQDSRCTPGTWTGLPRLLGYFEEIDKSRLGLVYRFPPSFSILPPERLAKSSLHELPTLSDLLSRPEPPLEAKFSLAFNLTNTIFDMHARGVTHGSLNDGNISFCYTLIENDGIDCYPVDIRRPLVSSFDLFPENDAQTGSSPWRHPSDPSASRNRHVSESPDRRALDLYSLAMALLAIGLWTKLDSLTVALSSPTTFGPVLDSLAAKCGSLYVKAVQSCRHAVDEAASCNSLSETLLPALQVRVSRYLEACCTLDGVSGLEGRLNKELNRAAHENRPPAKFSSDLKGLNAHFPTVDANKAVPAGPAAAHRQRSETADTTGNKLSDTTAREPNKSEAKTRLYPHVPLAPDVVATWNTVLMPQINHALRHFYRKHPESVEVSLESVGPSPDKTHPTVLIVCTSVGKVRAILKKRHGELFDGTSRFRLKVCKGHVLRSRGQPSPGTTSTARASHQHPYSDRTTESEDGEIKPANPDWQVRPDNGASIGACIGYRHLPPASFGGLIIVDNKPYGMTVHHMLDDSDQDGEAHETTRSSAADDFSWYPRLGDSSLTAGSDDFAQWLSDTESEAYSESEITSDYDDDGEEYVGLEPGDKAGIEPGDGEGYLVTQPALDDAPENFHPDPESVDEDHLSSFRLGEVYASSGIRRREENGLVHEVDWALFSFSAERLPDDNVIPRRLSLSAQPSPLRDSGYLRPNSVAPSSSLPGMEVQCVARTSGLQIGQILPTWASVKIYGRSTPSHSYQVINSLSTAERVPGRSMGMPGDSGAWVVDRHHGQLCGHVLAWSWRKRVAYICPMDVLLLDIAQTLGASEIRLPGSEPIVTFRDANDNQHPADGRTGLEPRDSVADLLRQPEGDEERLYQIAMGLAPAEGQSPSSAMQSSSGSHRGTPGPIRRGRSDELGGLSMELENVRIGRLLRGIGVS